MIQSLRASSGKWFFILTIVFILIVDSAILLDIPVLRQVLGIPFLVILPGLLVLFLLRLNRLGLAERLVLTIGLSVAFLMVFGLILNQICLFFGYTRPLSTNTLMFSLSGVLLVLAIGAYIKNKEAFLSFPFQLELNFTGKWCLLLPCFLPLLSILGTRLLDTSDNNIMLLVLLFLIPVSVVIIASQRHKITSDTYPIAIIMISFALLSIFWLRSEHILGNDVHREYYLFQMTLANSHWSIIENSTLDSCLSITLLPAMIQSLLHVSGAEYLFKGVFTIICTFTPLSVYLISKKYFGELWAFLAALFFISQTGFLNAPGSARTNLAIFFFALSIMVLFHKEITGVNKRVLFIVFMVATIVSHYTTTFLFLFLLLSVYLLALIFRKRTLSRNVTLTGVLLLVVLMFFWYGQLTQAPFKSGTLFISRTIANFYQFAAEEARSTAVSTIFGEGISEKIVLSRINFVFHWATYVFIAAGVIGTLIKRREMIASTRQRDSMPRFLQSKFETEFFFFTLACAGMLVAMIVLPYVSMGYGVQRLYSQMAVILSGFFILGCILISKFIKARPWLLMLLILAPYFLFTTGAIYEVSGVHGSMLLSSKAPDYNSQFVHDQETIAAQWLKEHVEGTSQILVVDGYSGRKLVSQGGISIKRVEFTAFRENEKVDGYLYLSYNNVVNKKFVTEDTPNDMNDYLDMIVLKNKLYTNGGSEIWR